MSSVDFTPIIQAVVGLSATVITAATVWMVKRAATYLGLQNQTAAINSFDDALTRAIHAGASAAQGEIAEKGWDHVDVKNAIIANAAPYMIAKFAPALAAIGLDPTDPNGSTTAYIRDELDRAFPTAMTAVAASPATPPAVVSAAA